MFARGLKTWPTLELFVTPYNSTAATIVSMYNMRQPGTVPNQSGSCRILDPIVDACWRNMESDGAGMSFEIPSRAKRSSRSAGFAA